MVRGIYQTSEARGSQTGIVSAAVAVLVLILCIAGILKAVNHFGGQLCTMAYYDQDVQTYKSHAARALSSAGYGYSKLTDKGDAWKRRYEPNPKVRKFLARDLVVPGDGRIEKAYVYVRFDSSDHYPVTTVQGYDVIR